MENAIHHMTEVPAELFGLIDRGLIEPGYHADVVIFDPDEIGATDLEIVHDLPGNSPRLWSQATGIRRVLVSGVTTLIDGVANEHLPGKVMRSGQDTKTTPLHPAL